MLESMVKSFVRKEQCCKPQSAPSSIGNGCFFPARPDGLDEHCAVYLVRQDDFRQAKNFCVEVIAVAVTPYWKLDRGFSRCRRHGTSPSKHPKLHCQPCAFWKRLGVRCGKQRGQEEEG
jgi:hypothetical protein